MAPGGEGEQLKDANSSLKTEPSKLINAIHVLSLSLLFIDQNISRFSFFCIGSIDVHADPLSKC